MAGTTWPALTAGRKAKASEVESKFDWIEGSIVPMSGGSQTDGAYDLGSATARWLGVYCKSINPTTTAGGVAIGTTTANAGALLDIAGVKAIILPRMTTAARNALTAVNGMLIYNSSDAVFQKYENSAWKAMGGNVFGIQTRADTTVSLNVTASATGTLISYTGSGRIRSLILTTTGTSITTSLVLDGTTLGSTVLISTQSAYLTFPVSGGAVFAFTNTANRQELDTYFKTSLVINAVTTSGATTTVRAVFDWERE